MACHRSGASLVACRADPCGRPVDRPPDNRGAHAAPLAGLDSPHAVSRTLQVHSAQPNLARSPARCNRREDAHFYQHHGFDWHEIQIAAEDDLEGDRTRGASTITQQLVKNLFFGTGRSILRKGAEVTLVPVAEFVLGKKRILEIYLNVVEWALVFMVQSRRVVTTTKPQPAISAGNRRHASLQFCQLPEATTRAYEQLQRDYP